jgi:hypothetical protein
MNRYFFVLILLLTGCGSNSLEDKIALKASSCTEPCLISLAELTNFKWDKMYASDLPSTLEEINRVIGTEYPYYEEFTRPIIFLNEGKIIYHENNPSNIEGVIDGQVIFGNATDTTKFRVFTVDKAVFKVRKRKSNNKSYYELLQTD